MSLVSAVLVRVASIVTVSTTAIARTVARAVLNAGRSVATIGNGTYSMGGFIAAMA